MTYTHMNTLKCEEPARSMVILGLNFNSRLRACFLGKSKLAKYTLKLICVRKTLNVTSKDLQKLVGYLVYAAWVMPFGRPFISRISHFIDVKNIYRKVRLVSDALVACDIWLFLLEQNDGLPFKLILGKLPRHKDEWFVDTADHGYAGVCGNSFFRISHIKLLR